MELRQLKSLVALTECGFNVTQAAEKLHLVQSAVSQHLTRLEAELGVVLLNRQGKRLNGLTPAGEQVLVHARKTLANTENILSIGKDFVEQGSGTLRIGTPILRPVMCCPLSSENFAQCTLMSLFRFIRVTRSNWSR